MISFNDNFSQDTISIKGIVFHANNGAEKIICCVSYDALTDIESPPVSDYGLLSDRFITYRKMIENIAAEKIKNKDFITMFENKAVFITSFDLLKK